MSGVGGAALGDPTQYSHYQSSQKEAVGGTQTGVEEQSRLGSHLENIPSYVKRMFSVRDGLAFKGNTHGLLVDLSSDLKRPELVIRKVQERDKNRNLIREVLPRYLKNTLKVCIKVAKSPTRIPEIHSHSHLKITHMHI